MRKGRFFCSWSGGKDSALALYHALSEGWDPEALLTMMIPGGRRSRSHGLRAEVLRAQSVALGVPLKLRGTTWNRYEETFGSALAELAEARISVGVFGDIDFERNRRWVEEMCLPHGIEVHEPLWRKERRALLEEFLALGFRARIVALRDEILSPKLLGELLSEEIIEEIFRNGIDGSGENGEYHTVVIDGPLFSRGLELDLGQQVYRAGYWFQDLRIG